MVLAPFPETLHRRPGMAAAGASAVVHAGAPCAGNRDARPHSDVPGVRIACPVGVSVRARPALLSDVAKFQLLYDQAEAWLIGSGANETAPPAQVKGAVAPTHRRVPLSADLIGDISM
jgi:hypothetical protein